MRPPIDVITVKFRLCWVTNAKVTTDLADYQEKHVIKVSSRRQTVIVLSSGESHSYTILHSNSIGHNEHGQGLRDEVTCALETDSVSDDMLLQLDTGKIRRADIQLLSVQGGEAQSSDPKIKQ